MTYEELWNQKADEWLEDERIGDDGCIAYYAAQKAYIAGCKMMKQQMDEARALADESDYHE